MLETPCKQILSKRYILGNIFVKFVQNLSCLPLYTQWPGRTICCVDNGRGDGDFYTLQNLTCPGAKSYKIYRGDKVSEREINNADLKYLRAEFL